MADEERIAPQVITAAMIFCIAVLVIGAGIEAIILFSAYVNADKVSCTWLWCEFTEVRGTANITVSQECKVNGVVTDCEEAANMTRLLENFGYEQDIVDDNP